jgi:hypothetical protein
MDPLLERLGALGLLRRDFLERVGGGEQDPAPVDADPDEPDAVSPGAQRRPPPPLHVQLLLLCDQRALEGGMSVALDVRSDELFGALCAAVGGSARRIKLLDVREGPPLELRISCGELEERWALEDLYALVNNVNDLLREDVHARAVAILGEWQDALQLWCVPRASLGRLLREGFFAPRNRHQLEGLAAAAD